MNTLIRSADGKVKPNINEVAVYWPMSSLTDIYAEDGFDFGSPFEPNNYGGCIEYPELIEFDYRLAALTMLAAFEQVERLGREANGTLVDVRAMLTDIACSAIAKAKGL